MRLTRLAAVLAPAVLGAFAVAGPASASARDPRPTPVAAGRLSALLAAGRRATSHANVDMGEILSIAGPGSGQILRIQTRYNLAKRIQASGIVEEAGLLRSDAQAVNTISVQDLVFGDTGYIRSTAAGSLWTKESLPPTAATAAGLPGQLLSLARPHGISRIAVTKTGSSYRIDLHASDLLLLRAFSNQFPSGGLHGVTAQNRKLLSGAVFSMPDLVITLDRQNRVTQLKGAGTLTETRAVAAANGEPYPRRGIAAVVIMNLVFRYGGALRIVAPPAAQVINPNSPLR